MLTHHAGVIRRGTLTLNPGHWQLELGSKLVVMAMSRGEVEAALEKPFTPTSLDDASSTNGDRTSEVSCFETQQGHSMRQMWGSGIRGKGLITGQSFVGASVSFGVKSAARKESIAQLGLSSMAVAAAGQLGLYMRTRCHCGMHASPCVNAESAGLLSHLALWCQTLAPGFATQGRCQG